MYDKSVTRSTITAALALTAVLAPAWAQPSKTSFPAQNSGAEQTLTGVVRDSICKVQNYPNHHKGVTPFSCTRTCVHEEGADYVLVVGDSVYILDGDRTDLDKFAGGRATITGRVDGNTVLVDSVSSIKKQG